jgi:hypothetical protein
LPVAHQIVRNEQDETFVEGEWVSISGAYSNAEAWEQIARQVDVELTAYSEPNPIYMGRVTIRPATRNGVFQIDIVVPDFNTEALTAIRQELNKHTSSKCSIVLDETERVLSIVAPLKTQLRVGNAVSMGLRFLLMDVIARSHQPFSFNCRYSLPGITDVNVKTDDGDVIDEIKGVRFGGIDVFRPPFLGPTA